MFKSFGSATLGKDFLEKNLGRLFHILSEIPKKIQIQVVSQAVEPLKIQDLRKSGNFKEIPEMLGLIENTQLSTQNANFGRCATTFQKISCKAFHGATYFT